jgi:hypothetical protein
MCSVCAAVSTYYIVKIVVSTHEVSKGDQIIFSFERVATMDDNSVTIYTNNNHDNTP